MKLVNNKSEMLKTPCEEFDFINPPVDPIEYAQSLVKCMYDKTGMGLSSNQIGDNYSVFAMRGYPENFVCYNPRIVDVSQELVTLDEGCLSYPNLVFKIKRPRHIKVRFATPNGEIRTERFTGMTARVFQHEMCHMRGEVFWNGINRYTFDKGIKKSKISGVSFRG